MYFNNCNQFLISLKKNACSYTVCHIQVPITSVNNWNYETSI